MFQWLLDGIKATYDALIAWLSLIFESLKNVLFDLPVIIFKKILDLIGWLFGQFNDSLSCCISGVTDAANALQTKVDAVTGGSGQIGQLICYFLSNSGFETALACISAGVMFRFTRKLITLGHW